MAASFSWTKQWYPLIPLDYLDSSHPTPITLLNKNLVIWRDQQENWRVMDDICPHKLAQLSLGTINDEGDLMCKHHGWSFDGEGKCTNIPMLEDSKALETACNSARSRITTYPTQVNQKLLWVWLDNSPTAFADCQLKHPATMPSHKFANSPQQWSMAEVPVGYTVSVESSFDPSHAQFLHEGTFGFSPDQAIPIKEFHLSGEMNAETGFTLKHTGYNISNQDMNATRKFTPPCSNTTIYEYTNNSSVLFQLYFVPTKPGYCRQIGMMVLEGTDTPKGNFLFNLLPKYLQTGIIHSFSYKLGDQDLAMMYSQTINESTENKTWQDSYFLPSVADTGIVTFRKWLDSFADGKPDWQNIETISFQALNDQQLYDRWHKHTKHCPSCRQSVLLIDKIRNLCQILAVGLAVLTLVLIGFELPILIAFLPIPLSLLSLYLIPKLDAIRQKFISSIPVEGLPIVKPY